MANELHRSSKEMQVRSMRTENGNEHRAMEVLMRWMHAQQTKPIIYESITRANTMYPMRAYDLRGSYIRFNHYESCLLVIVLDIDVEALKSS